MKLNRLWSVPIVIWITAMTAFAQEPNGLEGKWEATLGVSPNQLRLVLNISKASDGLYLGRLISLDQGAVPIPMENIQLMGDSVHFEVRAVNGVFQGTLSERTKIEGTWSQGGSARSLEFTRTATTAETPKPPDAAAVAATVLSSPFGIPMEISVPVPPTPFQADGKTHLVYELHLTNFSPAELLLTKLEVLNGDASLVNFSAGELSGLLQRPGSAGALDSRAVGPGARTIAYLWITIDPGAPVPKSIRHRITVQNVTLTGPSVNVVSEQPIVIGPPLRGTDWMAANGPGNGSAHRRALLPLNGGVHIGQRFAIDWVKTGPNGRTFEGDEKDNKTHYAYGSEILAVAEGVVSEVKDGIPENVPGPTSRAVPITPETIGGNHVVLNLGGGHYAFYAHMQPGSLRVKVGDKVRRGQVIGLVGNTGNSTEPHLHFQISDGNSALESEGLPYLLESFEVQIAPNTWQSEQKQLPLQNARVRFPDR